MHPFSTPEEQQAYDCGWRAAANTFAPMQNAECDVQECCAEGPSLPFPVEVCNLTGAIVSAYLRFHAHTDSREAVQELHRTVHQLERTICSAIAATEPA